MQTSPHLTKMVLYRSDTRHYSNILKSVNNLRHKKQFCDLHITGGAQEIYAHKCVLAAGSDYLMSSLMEHSSEKEAFDLSMVTKNEQVIESVINYLYSGEIDITVENLEEIIKVASYLLISDVRVFCQRLMSETMDSDTCLSFYLVAVEHLFPEVEIQANKIVKSMFHSCIIFKESAQKLSPTELQRLIRKCDIFERCSNKQILQFVRDWVQHGTTKEYISVGLEVLDTVCTKAACAGVNGSLSNEETLQQLVFQCQMKTHDMSFEDKFKAIWDFLESQDLLGDSSVGITPSSELISKIKTESNVVVIEKRAEIDEATVDNSTAHKMLSSEKDSVHATKTKSMKNNKRSVDLFGESYSASTVLRSAQKNSNVKKGEIFTDSESDSEKTDEFDSVDLTKSLTESTNHECSICGKFIMHKVNMKRHLRTHSTARPFPCKVCKKAFKDQGTLKQHMLTHKEKSQTCFICQKRFTRKSDLAVHMTVHTGEKNHVCSVCSKAFTQKAHLSVHMKLHTENPEPREKIYSCSQCQKMFGYKRSLRLHMLIHTGEKPHQCGFCGKEFRHKNNLTQHLKKHQNFKTECQESLMDEDTIITEGKADFRETDTDLETNPMQHTDKHVKMLEELQDPISKDDQTSSDGRVDLNQTVAKKNVSKEVKLQYPEEPKECDVCRKQVQAVNMKRHLQTHTADRPHACKLCNKTFKFKYGLTQHMPVHAEERIHPCPICHKLFLRKRDIGPHMLIHSENKPHVCSICGKMFRQRGQLTEHMKRHSTVRKFPCEFCPKKFTHKSNLRSHMKTHSDERAFVCETCGKRFKSRRGFKDHINLHTGKTFPCKICFRRFWWSAGLYKHMIVAHGGEQSHQCSVCGKQFKGKFYLSKHMIIHSDDKLHSCSSCGRGFKDKSALNRHERMHTGEKRHSCSICMKSFTRLENLRGHMQRFHKYT